MKKKHATQPTHESLWEAHYRFGLFRCETLMMGQHGALITKEANIIFSGISHEQSTEMPQSQ